MGSLFVVLSSVFFGINPILATILQRGGWSNSAVLMNFQIFGALYLLIPIRLQKLSLRISRRELAAALLLGGGTYWATNSLLQASYRLLPSPGLATVFHFVYPVVVMVIMALFFGEKITLTKLGCIAIALCGIFLITDITGGTSSGYLLGVILALASGTTYAVYIVSNDKSAAKTLPPQVLTFYVMIGGTICTAVNMLFSHDFVLSLEGSMPIFALLQSLCPFMALLTMAAGIRRIGPTRASVINMLEPVASVLISALVFRDAPLDSRTLLGGGLILLAAGLITLFNDTGKAKS